MLLFANINVAHADHFIRIFIPPTNQCKTATMRGSIKKEPLTRQSIPGIPISNLRLQTKILLELITSLKVAVFLYSCPVPTIFTCVFPLQIRHLRFQIHHLRFQISHLKFQIHHLKIKIHHIKYQIHHIKFKIHNPIHSSKIHHCWKNTLWIVKATV